MGWLGGCLWGEGAILDCRLSLASYKCYIASIVMLFRSTCFPPRKWRKLFNTSCSLDPAAAGASSFPCVVFFFLTVLLYNAKVSYCRGPSKLFERPVSLAARKRFPSYHKVGFKPPCNREYRFKAADPAAQSTTQASLLLSLLFIVLLGSHKRQIRENAG